VSSTRQRVALASTLALAVGAGTAATVARRRIRAQRGRPDSEARSLRMPPPTDRVSRVVTDDGVSLHVEEVGALDAAVTVVFAHGWTLTQECWLYQRRELAGADLRLVFYDQRGHGRSSRPSFERCTLDDLGRDLLTVIEAVEPAGAVVLVGHSMGGMTIMALADAHPELFGGGGPVRGVALLATSSGMLAEVTLGLPAAFARGLRRVLPRTASTVTRWGDRIESRRPAGGDLSFAAMKYFSYGGPVPPSLVELMERMVAQCPLSVAAQFGRALLDHDKLAALPALRDVATLVVVGDADVLTPAEHSRSMAAALPAAELVILPGAGHMLQLERPQLLTLHLRTLFARATAAAATA